MVSSQRRIGCEEVTSIVTPSLPTKDLRGERGTDDEDDYEPRDVADVRGPRISLPDPTQQRHRVRQREIAHRGRKELEWNDQPRHGEHWIENDRSDRLSEPRGRDDARDEEADGQDAPGAD